MQDKILRRSAVRDATGLSDSQIDRMEKSGEFPSRRQITERIVGWSHSEIQQWISEKLHGDKDTTSHAA